MPDTSASSRRVREDILFRECIEEARYTVNRTVKATKAVRKKMILRKAKDLFSYILSEGKKARGRR